MSKKQNTLDDHDVVLNKGLEASARGDFKEAIRIFKKLVKTSSHSWLGYYHLGMAYHNNEEVAKALKAYEDCIAIKPDFADVYCDRGVALADVGRRAEALDSYERAIQLDPNYAEAFYNSGVSMMKVGLHQEAVRRFQRTLELNPDFLMAELNLGVALTNLANYPEALRIFDALASRAPTVPAVFSNRGNVLFNMKRADAALQNFDIAISLKGDYIEALYNRALAFQSLRRFDDALKDYDAIWKLYGDYSYVRGQRLHMKLMCSHWDNLSSDIADLTRAVRRGHASSPPFSVLSLTDSYEDYNRVVDALFADRCGTFKNAEFRPAKAPGEPIRIAYVSADFRQHPIAQALGSILERHDRSLFKVFGISIGPTDDSKDAERMIKGCDRFFDFRGRSEFEIAAKIKSLGIDILLVTAVHTEFSKVELFAERLAPIQVNFLSAWSSGLEFFDYMTADPRCIPEQERQFFSEKLVSIRGFISDESQEISASKSVRSDFDLPEDAFVFTCFNDHYKINPKVFDSWMNILRRVEGSVLWLKDSSQGRERLRAEAAKRGIDPARLIFAKRVDSISDHLARLRLADLTLDTLPYGGHTTMRDSLFAGVPFVTQRGRTFVGQIGASLLDDVDLTELITSSSEEYENLAVELAHDRARLDAIRAQLRANLSSRGLFNTQDYIAKLDAALIAMYERFRAGLPPAHIDERELLAPPRQSSN